MDNRPAMNSTKTAAGSITDVAGIEVGHFTDTRRPTGCTVIITRDGAVFLDAYPVTLDQLAERLAAYKSANPALPVPANAIVEFIPLRALERQTGQVLLRPGRLRSIMMILR